MMSETFKFEKEIDFNRDEIITVYRSMEGEFEPINRLASMICGTPVSLVNFLDNDFQYTVSKYGDWSDDAVTPKQYTACQFTVLDDQAVIINDARKDERVKNIRQLVEDQSVRFYAGMPIKSPGGVNIGALCVLDFEPRELTDDQIQALGDLAKEIEYRIKLYKQKKKTDLDNKKLRKAAAFLNNSTDVLWSVDPNDFTILESKGAENILSTPDKDLLDESIFELIHEVNIQRHLKDWAKQKYSNERLGIPVKIELEPENVKWLLLTFSKYEDNLLITGKNVTEQHIAEENLKRSLEEKEVLLSEIHHRVKNNLAIVSSLLMLERLKSDNKLIQDVFLNSETRIITISKIHELLYKSKDFAQVELSEYVSDLLEYLEDAFPLMQRNIKLEAQISNIQINVNQALPVGLIINELVTNAIKYAFQEKESGVIRIIVFEKNNEIVQFEVSDNGDGIDIKPSELKEAESMGFNLVNTLKNQLEADLDIETENGTAFRFEFKKNQHKGTVSNLV